MTSRRAFLASLVAAIAGRSLFRKPKETGISIRLIRRCDWDPVSDRFITQMDVLYGFPGHSLFNPREDLAAQYKGLQFSRDAFTLVDSEFERGFAKIGAPLSVPRPRREATIPVPLLPSPIEFEPHFGVDFEWDVKELAA